MGHSNVDSDGPAHEPGDPRSGNGRTGHGKAAPHHVIRNVRPEGLRIDMVEEMVAKARRNARAVGRSNTDFRAGRADSLSLPEGAVDVVITNGMFNLCVDKPKVVAEVFRVLRPGGRLHIADILLVPHVTPEELAGKGTWSD